MIIFYNKGPLDIRAIKTFGMSAKISNDAIGFFGTGMKYAIAIFLRHNFSVKLYTDKKWFIFEKKTITSREKEFEIITMNGEEMPFTTHLGTNWELWQAFRELYCNALDEGGGARYGEYEYWGDDETVFIIEGDGSKDLFDQRDSIVLKGDFDMNFEGLKVINKPSEWLYYRGIRVFRAVVPFLYTYNITSPITLTEDRTIRSFSDVSSIISSTVLKSDNPIFIKKLICAKRDSPESGFRYWISETSKTFEEVAFREFDKNNDDLHFTVKTWVKTKKEIDTFKNIVSFKMTEVEEKMLDTAKRIVSKKFNIDKYEIVLSETLGERTMAYVSGQDDRVFLSRECFNQGQLFLTSTLLEEVVHKVTGFSDETRELQTYLFDELTKMIANKSGVPI